MAEIQPRIVGTEMEWSITERLVGNKHDQPFERGGELVTKYREPELSSSIMGSMLSNGSRYYRDVGEHVEYASPEDTSFKGALVNELAGEQILIDGLARYVRDNDKIAHCDLRKRVVDDRGETWGYHINLSADRKRIPSINDQYVHLLGLHLATSLPMLGAGTIFGLPGREQYSFGQKILGLHHDYCRGTMDTEKALINQRDEPWADKEVFHRIHLTSTDPHISPWATRMALGTASLVLRAIEQEKGDWLRIDDGGHENPLLGLARMNARDLTLKQTTMLVGGKTITPTDIQQEIINIVSQTDHTDEEAEILREWQTAVEDLSVDPMRLVNRSDAITKLDFIQKLAEKNGEDITDVSTKKARALVAFYDVLADLNGDELRSNTELTPMDIHERSLGYKLRIGRMASMMATKNDVMHAVHFPPVTTRAYQRGNAIWAGGVTGASWSGYTEWGEHIHTLYPYNSPLGQ